MTVAEKVSVLPSRTVPELGAMAMVICGGGGGVMEPPPPPPLHAAREKARARKIVRAMWRGTRGLRVEGPCFERVCERGRMEIAIADKGPAKERDGAESAARILRNFGSSKVSGTKGLELVSREARTEK